MLVKIIIEGIGLCISHGLDQHQEILTATGLPCSTGFFVHTILCIQPIIYKKIMETDNFKLADDTLEAYYKAVLPPFFIGYGFIIVVTVCVIAAILRGFLDVPKWFVLLNPLVFLMVGMELRKLAPNKFYDLPGIVMPSLGFGMFGLIAIVSLI